MRNTEDIKGQNANSEFTFLVLMNFSEASYIALKYAISIAKLAGSKIHVLHAANTGSRVSSENRALASRTIESETRKIKNKLNSIFEIITAEGVKASTHYSVGNIIHEFQHQVDKIHPDVVVVGKKKEKRKFSGRLSNHLLNKYNGSVLIVDEDTAFKTGTKMAIACNSKMLNSCDSQMAMELDALTKTPITLLTVRKPAESKRNTDLAASWQSIHGAGGNIQCASQENASVAQGLVDYISDKQIELLCMGRGKPRGFIQNLLFSQDTTMSYIVNQVKVPVLLLGYHLKKEDVPNYLKYENSY